ncbi:unnamed protein product, partial [Mesorhabditis spiculigera]
MDASTAESHAPPPNSSTPTSAERWLHCNACFTLPGGVPAIHYYFVTCGHIFCKACCAKGASFAKNRQCFLCKKEQVQYMEINRNIVAKFRNLFRPAKDLAQEMMAELQRVLEFQARHKNGLMKHVTLKTEKAVGYAKSARGEIEKMKSREQGLLKQCGTIKKHNEKITADYDQLKQDFEELRNKYEALAKGLPNQPDYLGGAPGLGDSQSFSGSLVFDAVTSTPNGRDIVISTRNHLAEAFKTNSGTAPSPIISAKGLLTTPAMLGLQKPYQSLSTGQRRQKTNHPPAVNSAVPTRARDRPNDDFGMDLS